MRRAIVGGAVVLLTAPLGISLTTALASGPASHPLMVAPTNSVVAASIAGTVVGLTGGGLVLLVAATVGASDANGTSVGSTTTDFVGHYQIAGLSAGTYTVTFAKVAYLTTSRTISLASGEAKQVDMTLVTSGEAGTLTGTVTDAASGLPISTASVQVSDLAGIVTTVATDLTGSYQVGDLVPGETVSVSFAASGYQSSSGTMTMPATLLGQATLDAALLPTRAAASQSLPVPTPGRDAAAQLPSPAPSPHPRTSMGRASQIPASANSTAPHHGSPAPDIKPPIAGILGGLLNFLWALVARQ